VVESKTATGVDRIYFPGEIEQIEEQQRLRYGIPMTGTELAALNNEARSAGIEPLKPR
jgi:LDH2 family malate/lactate/ureidoglycolate dehydrogenase